MQFYLIIKNDGEIVPPEMGDKIFDPFYQLKKNAKINASSGIGLSLARSLAELHHGVLLYKSNDGLNIFTLAIPKGDISRQETNIDIYNDDFVEQQSKQETILVVEDNLELLSFMTEKLSLNFSVE